MRVQDERVGVLDPVVGASDARGEQPGATVGTVDVEPQAVVASDLRRTGQVVDDAGVGGASRGDTDRIICSVVGSTLCMGET